MKLQPLVFDLLCYLVRHRERVVTKDELLEALWPRTIVVDNALQRVVSLARNALAEAGLADAIRTYPRHGYRFCIDDGQRAAEPLPADDRLAAAHAACERSDWAAACEAFAAADAHAPLAAEDIEIWGRAAICGGQGPGAVGALERLVAERSTAGDALTAARAMLLLAQIRIDQRQSAIARGLLQRASRFLDGQADTIELGHCAWMSARMALAGGDAEGALAQAREACRIGRALHDADVECLGLTYLGHGLMSRGDVAEGLAQHDEAAAMIRLGGVCPWAAGWSLCSILYAARYRNDWLRAAQFAQAFEEWSRASRMPAFPGTCQLHRAAVLNVQGELEQAAAEVRSAAAMLAQAAPWAEGDAYCVLGDIQLSVGDLEDAEASYRQAHALGWNPQPGLARLHLLAGRAAEAQRGLEQALDAPDFTLRERRAQLLCLLVHAAVAAGDTTRAREAMASLDGEAHRLDNESLTAMRNAAQAELALAEGNLRLATSSLRRAIRDWHEVGSPVGEVEARLRLAECLLADGDPRGAELELHALQTTLAPAARAHRGRVDALRARLLNRAG
ncbi:winged helix-turn-helix domain-containing protein [uncultured Piscinibacter sp.]|uniref:winged helix-turn-helix domain-containing protein n=1 Tax=uncultured Piscinibacter sp. TaxID=1131835 RepID=UPI00261A8CD2|nr:winged helix-turn-helix domain-containing protein [uncultured Piscinibacter sp.]